MQIRHTWDAAITAVGMVADERFKIPLNDSQALLEYQEGELTDSEFGAQLGSWFGITPDQAIEVHLAILGKDYPGAATLIRDLKENDVFTCCFSNTNSLHWSRLISPDHHPALALLDAKFASHELHQAKPLHSAYQAVEARFPPHHQVIFFDDTAVNVEAAKECGWNAYRVNPLGDPVAELKNILRELRVLA